MECKGYTSHVIVPAGHVTPDAVLLTREHTRGGIRDVAMKALSIDDSRVMRRILSRVISGCGCDMVEAEDGQDALNVLGQTDDIGLVLVNWSMPGMNGLEFVEAVRARPEYSALHLVMVTTESEPTHMARALMAGVDEFVMKPFTPEILLVKLELFGVKATVAS